MSDLGKGAIAWMAQNRVAANLAMLVLMVGGAVGLSRVNQETFPEFTLDIVVVSVPYPGASPTEVEQGITLAVEEAVTGIDGVKRVTSESREGTATVGVELLRDADPETVRNDVSSAVDRITTFPEEAEEPTVALATARRQVLTLVISGDLEMGALHEIAEETRARLLLEEDITQVDLSGVPPLEVSIEVPRDTLESLGLTLEEVAQQVAAASVEMPGGGLETRGGEILVRVDDRRRRGHELEEIVIRGTADGMALRLGDVATVRDGYEDTDQAAYFDGHPSVGVRVYRVGDETPTAVATASREVADLVAAELPESVSVNVWNDTSVILEERIDLLVRNAWIGFVLVVLVLGLFLRVNLAGWIALGIPISFLGAFALMPGLDLTVNMITLMAFIITLGLVVDDAIIVGENIFSKMEEGMPRARAAIEGAREMAMPVTFSVLTTVAAFSPLFSIPGVMGKVFWSIPAVVLVVLLFSLLESFFILPAHLGHGPELSKAKSTGSLARLRQGFNRLFERFTERLFRPVVEWTVRWRYTALAGGVALLMGAVSLVASGIVPFKFFPHAEDDEVTAAVRLPRGAPEAHTARVRAEVEAAARRAADAHGGREALVGMFTVVGQGPASMGPAETGGHLLTVELSIDTELTTGSEMAAAWAEELPELAGVESTTFSYTAGPTAGAAVDVQLRHGDEEVLAVASEELASSLRGYRELTSVENTWSAGTERIDYHLRPGARSLGLTGAELARQLRGAFFGSEAIREQRGRNELVVMVRLPEAERQSEHDLDRLLVSTPQGGRVALSEVATAERSRAPTVITREESERTVNVSAELAAGAESPREVLASLDGEVFPALVERHPGLQIELGGEQREQTETFSALGSSYLIALVVIFALLAIPLRSYSQPFAIMMVIPFGFVGAVAGHALLGMQLSLMSILGYIALSGVVVNDSLLLVNTFNGYRAEGLGAREAVVRAATRRLRPILLTSLTTFLGLVPMITETSVQAQMLVPMAVSLGFGILFATVIVLLLVPGAVMVLEDIKGLLSRSREGQSPTEQAEPVAEPVG